MELKWIDMVRLLIIFQLSIFIFFLIHKGRKNISNIILALFFLAQIIGVADSLMYSLSEWFYRETPSLLFLGRPVVFLWAPLMFLYVKSLVYKDFRLKWIQLLHMLPCFLSMIFFIAAYHLQDIETKISILENRALWYPDLSKAMRNLLYVHVMCYNILSLVTLERFKRKIKNENASIEDIKLSWLKLILYSYIVASLMNVILHIPGVNIIPATNNFLTILAFLIFFTMLFYKALISPDIFVRTDENTKYKTSSLEKEEARFLIERLDQHMQSNKPFLEPTITIKQLADQLSISDRLLSQLINEYKQKNFYDYINAYRIEFAKKLIEKSNDDKITILEILYEAGFNSKSAFNLSFKKVTGITPTQFRNKAI